MYNRKASTTGQCVTSIKWFRDMALIATLVWLWHSAKDADKIEEIMNRLIK